MLLFRLLLINIVFFQLIFFFTIILIFSSRNNFFLILVFMDILSIINAVLFSLYSILHNDYVGQIYALFILSVAAAETALGLSIYIRAVEQVDLEYHDKLVLSFVYSKS